MSQLQSNLQKLKEMFHMHGIPAEISKNYWNEEQLTVPIVVDDIKNEIKYPYFGLIIGGQPILTALPVGRYLTVRIPRFYTWWEDLNQFPEVLQKATTIAYELCRRNVYLDFFIDYVDCDVISFAMNAPLKEKENIADALPVIFDQLCEILKAVYSYLRRYDAEYEEAGE